MPSGQWAALTICRNGLPGQRSRRRLPISAVVECCWLAEVRDRLNFEADGLVIKIDDFATQERLSGGQTLRGMVAYKYPAAEAVTRLVRIVVMLKDWQSELLASLEPVRIGG